MSLSFVRRKPSVLVGACLINLFLQLLGGGAFLNMLKTCSRDALVEFRVNR